MKNLINQAIAILEATVPKLSIGFRLVVYYPPTKDYHLAAVSKIEGNKASLLFDDVGKSFTYSIDSPNIIGKTEKVFEYSLNEDEIGPFIKSYFVKPTEKMIKSKVSIKELTVRKKAEKNEKEIPSAKETADYLANKLNIDEPIYETVKKYAFHKYVPDDRHPKSSTNLDTIYKPRGTFKKDFDIEKFLHDLKKNRPNIKVIEPSKIKNYETEYYSIRDTHQGGILIILLADKNHKQASWYYT